LCGLVDARVIDLDGVYNPCLPNDRLLLGMKGSISEFELGVLRSRMLDAARSKAQRGELRLRVPIGYIWHREIGLGLDPDSRVQEAIRAIFRCFRELGSGRRVHFPHPSDGKTTTTFDWTLIRYRNVISVLKNPVLCRCLRLWQKRASDSPRPRRREPETIDPQFEGEVKAWFAKNIRPPGA
jgi:hypothetical protein